MSLSALGRLSLRPTSYPSHTTNLAAECRATANELLQADGWGRVELATWLAGPYRHAARFSNDAVEEEATPLSGTQQRRLSVAAPPSDAQVNGLVEDAQKAVLQMVEQATMQSDFEALADACLRAGFVKKREMSDGTTRLVPMDRARMTLVDRVLSLLIAARTEPTLVPHESGLRRARPDPRRE